jgi:hypothetical protein
MAASSNLLAAKECSHGTKGGKAIRKLHDYGGLYLLVYEDGRKYWRLRHWVNGKEQSLLRASSPKSPFRQQYN